jgi:hypothetical protein
VIRPGDDGHAFLPRWHTLVRSLLVETSVKAVALVAAHYANFDNGESCHPGTARVARETGLSERSVRTAFGVLRGLGMAVRVEHAVAHRRRADAYALRVPDDWASLPLLGPSGRPFRCVFCRSQFAPAANCHLQRNGTVTFDVGRLTFCPRPRGRPGCLDLWDKARAERGEPTWSDLGAEQWVRFREARGDDW